MGNNISRDATVCSNRKTKTTKCKKMTEETKNNYKIFENHQINSSIINCGRINTEEDEINESNCAKGTRLDDDNINYIHHAKLLQQISELSNYSFYETFSDKNQAHVDSNVITSNYIQFLLLRSSINVSKLLNRRLDYNIIQKRKDEIYAKSKHPRCDITSCNYHEIGRQYCIRDRNQRKNQTSGGPEEEGRDVRVEEAKGERDDDGRDNLGRNLLEDLGNEARENRGNDARESRCNDAKEVII